MDRELINKRMEEVFSVVPAFYLPIPFQDLLLCLLNYAGPWSVFKGGWKSFQLRPWQLLPLAVSASLLLHLHSPSSITVVLPIQTVSCVLFTSSWNKAMSVLVECCCISSCFLLFHLSWTSVASLCWNVKCCTVKMAGLPSSVCTPNLAGCMKKAAGP
ncbi:hypothetical protein LR48_Vigan07g177600 [Vigna angularis]|uniref:Uncharacterized protein n=2 Tax=Phaseolus angularis TaxID=3914 RepID=A0A0L9UZR7_PHAAN|nr:hypothetical protein LR48_Vigan07g177600 [Vigna angularis]BAT81622.1 hypothetical protein VIGAN_03139000 [Vigna angularis var. angularis]